MLPVNSAGFGGMLATEQVESQTMVPYPKLDKVVQDGAQPGIYEDRMTIMIDDGKVPLIARAKF